MDVTQRESEMKVGVEDNVFPKSVQHDMDFIKQSWANMAEEPAENVAEVDNKFQLVVLKQTKKKEKTSSKTKHY